MTPLPTPITALSIMHFLDAEKIKVVAFDLFGTVFDADSASAEDRTRYGDCLRAWRERREYHSLFDLSSFYKLKPLADSLEGLQALRDKGYQIVAASNIPMSYVRCSSRCCGLLWDGILDLENYHIYKPDLAAYAAICDLKKCEPSEVLFVTGNHGKYGIGDDTAPLQIGMPTMCIRRDSEIKDIVHVAELMRGHSK